MNKIKKMLDGNGAVSEAMKLARVAVIAAYPITPQSPIAEKLADMASKKEIEAKYICVESEHSALSYVVGAGLTGVRAGTATSSVGLALMHEIMGVASGCRVPIVMPIVNRALVSPWSLWCDHQDSMGERDSGWIQVYAENAQEVFDLVIMAYRIAEHEEVQLPLMVCMDGFFVSHSIQPVLTIEQEEVDKFIPRYKPANLHLDTKNPMFINNLTPPEEFTEMRYQQEVAFDKALEVIPIIQKEFEQLYQRNYSLIDEYCCEDAEAVLVGIGSMCGTMKEVVKKLRANGKKVGMVKVTVFRPFPVVDLKKVLSTISSIGVFDRSAGLGAESGPLCNEVKAVLGNNSCKITNFIGGLGGRDITEATIEKAFEEIMKNQNTAKKIWIDTREDALEMRTI